jgi:S1-C subfamily serine protease
LRLATTAIVPVVLCARVAFTQTDRPAEGAAAVAAIEQSVVTAIARAEPSVVAISRWPAANPPQAGAPSPEAFGQPREETGSQKHEAPVVGAGVIIDPGGLVLTQYLSVREGDTHRVTTTEGKTYDAVIRAADPRSGLAVLAIGGVSSPEQVRPRATAASGRFPAIRFADETPLRKGQFVVVVGNPFSIQQNGEATSSWGTITNIAVKAPDGTNFNDAPGPYEDYNTTLHHLGDLIQTDAKLGWSAGGGALVNLRGELVGITTTAAEIAGHEAPAGYAIPLNATIRRVIETLQQGREVEYGMLGIGFGPPLIVTNSPNEPESDAPRLVVSQVYPGAPAARAGLAAGDILTQINDKPVEDIAAVQLAVSALAPGTVAEVSYQRAGRAGKTTVTLGKLAVSGRAIATVRPEAWQGIRVDYATAMDADALAQAISSGALDEQGCVLVKDVELDSAAWRAGVRPGMFVSSVGGKRVSTPDEFRAAVGDGTSIADLKFTKPLVKAEEQGGDN